jgi:hypothetical protein
MNLTLTFAILLSCAPNAKGEMRYPPQPVRVERADVHDPRYTALRAKLREAVARRDVAAVRALAGSTFFWRADFGGAFDPTAKPGDNLLTALSLADVRADAAARVWREVATMVDGDDASPAPDAPGTLCIPPRIAPKSPGSLERTTARLDSEGVVDWAVVTTRTPVLAQPSAKALVVSHLESEAVFITERDVAAEKRKWWKVALPSGKTGYVAQDATTSFGVPQLCFGRQADGEWKIVGYSGGGD